MIIMRNIIVFIIPILLMSGCLTSEASPVNDNLIIHSEEISDNQSYQFWNAHPMSIGNNSLIAFNNTGQLFVTLELNSFFHEPVWEQGYVNYSIIYNNETVWSIQSNGSITLHTFNMTNVTGNMVIQIQANGSDNQTDNKPGDLYIAKAEFELIY